MPPPCILSIYAAILLQLSFNNFNSSHSVKVRFRYDGNLFDLRRLKARSKVKYMYIQEAQYAHHIALFSNSAEGLQDLLSAHNHVSKEMGLQINTSKGGFPLSRNFYVRTDVNFNWLYVRELK